MHLFHIIIFSSKPHQSGRCSLLCTICCRSNQALQGLGRIRALSQEIEQLQPDLLCLQARQQSGSSSPLQCQLPLTHTWASV